MSGRRPRRLAAGLVLLAMLPAAAAAQVQLQVQGRVEVQAGGVIVIQPAPGQADGQVRLRAMVAPPVAADDTIGDPWWDEAAGEDALPDGAAEEVPADQGERLRRLAREQAQRQRRGQLMGELRRELSLVRDTCPSLEPAARGRILAAGRADVAAAAARGGRLGAAVPEAVLREASPAEAEAYARQQEDRVRRRRAAAIAVVVAAVDREVWLEEPQRRALAEAIATAWGPAWESLVAVPPGRPIMVSNVPAELDACLLAAVGPEALAAWQRVKATTPSHPGRAEARPR